MAILISTAIGKLKGRAGDMVFRNEKGKNIMSLYPKKKINASKTPQAIRARKNFSISVKFSKSVNSIPALKEIWNRAKIEARDSYQKLMKLNLKAVKDTSATTLNKITPDGLPLILSSASVEDNNLKLDFNLPSVGNIQFPAGTFVLMYFDKYDKSVFKLISEIEEPASDGFYQKSITFDDNIIKAFEMDPNPIVYVALAGSAPHSRKIYWTSTAATQL